MSRYLTRFESSRYWNIPLRWRTCFPPPPLQYVIWLILTRAREGLFQGLVFFAPLPYLTCSSTPLIKFLLLDRHRSISRRTKAPTWSSSNPGFHKNPRKYPRTRNGLSESTDRSLPILPNTPQVEQHKQAINACHRPCTRWGYLGGGSTVALLHQSRWAMKDNRSSFSIQAHVHTRILRARGKWAPYHTYTYNSTNLGIEVYVTGRWKPPSWEQLRSQSGCVTCRYFAAHHSNW